MKLRKVQFNNHKVLGNLEISFQDANKNTLDTVVLIGENGAGKTTILKEIYNLLDLTYAKQSQSKMFLTLNNNESIRIESSNKGDIDTSIRTMFDTNNDDIILQDNTYDIERVESDIEKIYNKVIYMPTEINFNSLNTVDRAFKYEYKFRNEVNQNLISNLPSAIANRIYTEIIKNEDLPAKESREKVCEEINSIFKCMDLEVEFVGLSKDEDTVPMFKDSTGNEFDIENLSSGEKQLFLRALSLKFLNANNSIILIDEPEISLHPQWQRKIIDVYEGIGENNQLIIATHSPHVVGDTKREQLRVLRRDENGVSIVDNDKLDETYGHTVESILMNTMNLTQRRNNEVTVLLDEIRELVNRDLYESNEFKELFKQAKKYLGTIDQDIVLINMDIKRRKLKKVKENAEGK